MALVVVACTLASITSCTEKDDELGTTYGYVQFKLYKNDTAPTKSATRATGVLNYLSDACKIGVSLERPDGSVIEQTLVLRAYNEENAAYGMRSDKLQLLAGEYKVTCYRLYGKVDEIITSVDLSSLDASFTVVTDGLVYHDLSVDVTPRGKASFRLVKPESFTKPTRAAKEGVYPFSDIQSVSFILESTSYERVEVNNVLVKLEEGFHDYAVDGSEYNAQTTTFAVDTIVPLKAGEYKVISYTTYSDKKAKKELETAIVKDGKPFVVGDNGFTEDVEIVIQMKETAEYVKDYLALKEIWEALDGPHWSYHGEAEVPGCNWDFNKDLDKLF